MFRLSAQSRVEAAGSSNLTGASVRTRGFSPLHLLQTTRAHRVPPTGSVLLRVVFLRPRRRRDVSPVGSISRRSGGIFEPDRRIGSNPGVLAPPPPTDDKSPPGPPDGLGLAASRVPTSTEAEGLEPPKACARRISSAVPYQLDYASQVTSSYPVAPTAFPRKRLLPNPASTGPGNRACARGPARTAAASHPNARGAFPRERFGLLARLPLQSGRPDLAAVAFGDPRCVRVPARRVAALGASRCSAPRPSGSGAWLEPMRRHRIFSFSRSPRHRAEGETPPGSHPHTLLPLQSGRPDLAAVAFGDPRCVRFLALRAQALGSNRPVLIHTLSCHFNRGARI